MAISELDKTTALIIIDLQKGITGLPVAHSMTGVIENAASLASAFRREGLPVVLVNVVGGAPGRTERQFNLKDLPADWAELIPELGQQPTDHIVSKRTWGAFTGTDLEGYLKNKGVTQVVVCGVATSAGAESTARQAHELGFNVTLATDAMTDLSAEAHENSVERIFPKLGETGTTAEILDRLPTRIAR